MIHKTRGLEIKARKNEIRTEYKARRAALAPDVKQAYDEKICALFLASITYRYAKTLLLYAPYTDEIDIMPIAEKALADGKTIAFPRCRKETCEMDYHIITGPAELKSGAYGIREPDADAPVYLPADNNEEHPVCIVPGLVFDGEGYRVGYGKGYYDRFLAGFTGVRVGMVYTDFILQRVPRGRFDLSVDVLVTEKGVRAVHAN